MTLELDGVGKVVGGETHIHPTDLRLEPASMNVLLGPTLAGKTSLMRLMAGLDRPTSGRVLWQGADVTGRRVQERGVAMVYQQFINYPTLSVYENIASPLRLAGKSRAELDASVDRVAGLMQLGGLLDRRPLELSGGQQQRTALARALVKEAGLVLLDEPLANLDYKLREELRAEIPRIFEEAGSIFVYATTEPEEALLLGGNTATLWQGAVTQFGPTPQVYRQPADATTARVFSDPPMNFLDLARDGTRVVFEGGPAAEATGRLADLAEGRYAAGFRPDRLAIARPGPQALAFRVRLLVTEITGSETYLHVGYGDKRWVGVAPGVQNVPPGSDIEVYLDPRHIYIFGEDGRLIAPAEFADAA